MRKLAAGFFPASLFLAFWLVIVPPRGALAAFDVEQDCRVSCLGTCAQNPASGFWECSVSGTGGGGLFGKIKPPPGITKGLAEGGLAGFLSAVFGLLVLVAGIYALFNFIFAGYQFMSAGGDPKGVQAAWGRIWQTLVGMIIVVSSFLLAAILGFLLFGDTGAILSPKLITP